jgi:hypothetical protein
MDWELIEETEELRDNLSHCHFACQKSHMTWPKTEPRLMWWEASNFNEHMLINLSVKLTRLKIFLILVLKSTAPPLLSQKP